jgi:hypothetical protein
MKKIITITAIILLSFSTFAFAELTKEVVVDKMEILEDGTIQVRTATRILEDGKVLSQSFHRHVISPGQDYSNEATRVKAVADTVQTQAVKDAYTTKMEALNPVAEPK